MEKKQKIRYTVTLVLLLTLIMLSAVIHLKTWKDSRLIVRPVDAYLSNQLQQKEDMIKQREQIISEMYNQIRRTDSLIRELEKKRASITNKYYYNEKEILTSGDSANRVMRMVNQSLFESEYFNGKYAPSK